MNSEFFYSLERPLHLLPSHSQVRSVNLKYLPEYVSRLGGDYRDILGRYDIEHYAALDPEAFIDCKAFVDMFEYCAQKFNDPLFGFHLAQKQQADVYGFVTALCRSAATIGEAVQCLIDYLPLIHSTESVLELVKGKEISELRWTERSNMGSNDQANCQGLLLNLKLLQEIGGESFTAAYVTLPAEVYHRISQDVARDLRCPLRINTGRLCIAFRQSVCRSQRSMRTYLFSSCLTVICRGLGRLKRLAWLAGCRTMLPLR